MDGFHMPLFSYQPLKERLREAARQQVRRMCQLKKKRKNLNPPEWLLDAYKNRNKTELADMLMSCNFQKDRFGVLN